MQSPYRTIEGLNQFGMRFDLVEAANAADLRQQVDQSEVAKPGVERGERSGQMFEVRGLVRKTDSQIVGGLGATVQNGRPAAGDYKIDLRINQRLYRGHEVQLRAPGFLEINTAPRACSAA